MQAQIQTNTLKAVGTAESTNDECDSPILSTVDTDAEMLKLFALFAIRDQSSTAETESQSNHLHSQLVGVDLPPPLRFVRRMRGHGSTPIGPMPVMESDAEVHGAGSVTDRGLRSENQEVAGAIIDDPVDALDYDGFLMALMD